MRLHYTLISLLLIVTVRVCTAQPVQKSPDQNSTIAKGATVSNLSTSIWRIFQTRNNEYWFGSGDDGVYRYDGKNIVNFTTKDGLCNNRIWAIQEDKSGNIYFTTPGGVGQPDGISKFDGRAFTTLRRAAERSPMTEWKLQPDDLWFQGAQDAGVVYRYDGKTLHALEFPRTKLGDEHYARFPRSKFPNAIYSPYDVYGMLKDSKGNLWFGTTCVGVCRFDGKSFTWMTDHGLTDAPVRSIVEDRNGDFWFSYSGEAPFDGFRKVTGMDQLRDRVKGTIVSSMSIVEDNDGNIWTASFGGGVRKYDGKRQTHYPIKDGDTNVTLFSIYKDRRGALWLGSHNAGALKFTGRSFEKFKP